MRLDFVLYLLITPVIVCFILFRVLPIWNMRLALFDYKARTPWVYQGLKYFKMIFSSPNIRTIIGNTLVISFMKYILAFPLVILFALLLNELRGKRYRQVVQVAAYLPHFLSWVVIAGIWNNILSPSQGIINALRELIGLAPRYYMTEQHSIRWILFLSSLWRNIGWDSIIYFAVIIGIDQTLYEAAEIDGASRFRVIVHIILPALVLPMTTIFILNLGYFFDAGFDQIYNMSNDAVLSVIDIFDTYIYRIGLIKGQYSLATAVGVFKGVIGMMLVMGTHFLSKRLTGKGIW